MKGQRSARIALKTSWKKKTIIGVAASIRASGQERCGGVAEKLPRRPGDVNSQSMRRMMKMMMMMMVLRKWKTNKTSSVAVATRWVIKLITAHEIRTLKLFVTTSSRISIAF